VYCLRVSRDQGLCADLWAGTGSHTYCLILERPNTAWCHLSYHWLVPFVLCCSLQNEYCQTISDFLARRTRLAFLDLHAALQAGSEKQAAAGMPGTRTCGPCTGSNVP
jgi:hypothetical protein